MGNSDRKTFPYRAGILVFSFGIFLFDLLTPFSWAVWLLYLLPLLIIFDSPHVRDPIYFGSLVSVLTVLGLVLSPTSVLLSVETLNRMLGLVVMWAFVVILMNRRKLGEGMAVAITEREQAEKGQAVAVAERQHVEERLAVSTLRLEGIVQSAMDAILTVNEQQEIVLFNKAAEQMFRCSAGDAIGGSLDRFIPPRFRNAHRDHVHTFGHTNVTSRKMGALGAITGIRGSGEEFPIEAAISQINLEGRKFYTVILRDITERKLAEEQLRRTERLAELGTLAAGMAHEIGTPMNVILGRAEHLLQRAADERVRKGLEIIIVQIERITKIMNQLLTFARRRPLERRPMDLRRTITDCLDVMQERIAQHGIKVEHVWAADLPSAYADPDQMSQVLLNLIINAIHAMPDGGTMKIGLQRDDKGVRLTVADTGCGIPPQDIPKIFNPFFTTKEVGQGTGLGLTVVHGIVREHGGSIDVESEAGCGTMFSIVLPVIASDLHPKTG